MCVYRDEGIARGNQRREMPQNSGLVTRHADATRVYRLDRGSLAIIIFDRQLLLAGETGGKRGRGTMARAGDDYNFSVSITVATRLAAIFQRPKVHAASRASIIIAQHSIDRMLFHHEETIFAENTRDLNSM